MHFCVFSRATRASARWLRHLATASTFNCASRSFYLLSQATKDVRRLWHIAASRQAALRAALVLRTSLRQALFSALRVLAASRQKAFLGLYACGFGAFGATFALRAKDVRRKASFDAFCIFLPLRGKTRSLRDLTASRPLRFAQRRILPLFRAKARNMAFTPAAFGSRLIFWPKAKRC